MKELKELIDKKKLKQEIEKLEDNLRRLHGFLEDDFKILKMEIAYHNGNPSYSVGSPEDDYYFLASLDYSDNFKNELIAVDEILQEKSNHGRYISFKLKSEGIIVSPILSRIEFENLIQLKEEKEIRQLIKEYFKISHSLEKINQEIDKFSKILEYQRRLKGEYQDEEVIDSIFKILEKSNTVKDEFITQLHLRDHELKERFGIDIEEIEKKIRKIY